MSDKKQIALVSATFNAVNPMMDYIAKNVPYIKPVNYLDGYMMEKIGKEGITDECKLRIMDLITRACNDGADGIILTCTIFSLYQPYFEKIFSCPIVTPDGAMLDAVSRLSGRTAILCTFEGTMETTKTNYLRYKAKNKAAGDEDEDEAPDMYLIPEAYEAMQSGHAAESYQYIQRKVMELDSLYDYIVLAQISMSGAAEGLVTNHAKVFTSPSSAVNAILNAIHD